MMKLCVAASLFVALVCVYAEHCQHDNHHECHVTHPVTHCHNGTHVFCINGWCECSYNAPGGKTCTQLSDCQGTHCDQNAEHCIDGHCRCTSHHPGGPGGAGGAGGQP